MSLPKGTHISFATGGITPPASSSNQFEDSSGATYATHDAAANANTALGTNPKKSAPTVITDANIREKAIPGMEEKVKTLVPQYGSTFFDPVTGQPQGVNKYDANTGKPLADPNASPSGETPDDTDTDNASYEKMFNDIYNPVASAIDNSPEYKSEQDLLAKMQKSSDAEYAALAQSITSKYGTKYNTLVNQQKGTTAQINNALLLGNSSRYAPVSSGGVLSAKQKFDMQTLTDLQDQETVLQQQALAAKQSKDYELLGKHIDMLEDIRKQKLTLANKINDELAAEAKTAREKDVQASRDSSIAGLLQQGITDPKQLLDYLNFDDQGNRHGDFTAKEINDTLKSLAPEGDIEKLSGVTRDFFILKGLGQLPGSVTTLPEDQQLFAYMRSQREASTKPGSGGTSGNKITWTEATNRGLPISTVGMSENEIIQSFYDETPPAWFQEKVQNERGQTIQENDIQSVWDEYRGKMIENEKDEKSSDKTPTAKVIGVVRALRDKDATEDEINEYINYSGYNPDDPAFK